MLKCISLLALCFLQSTMSSRNVFAGYTIVGVFDDEEHAVMFEELVYSETEGQASLVNFITNNTTPNELQTELCALDRILYIYVVATNYVIQFTTTWASIRDVPVFVFDTHNTTTQMNATANNQFYMNNHLRDEGDAFAKIAYAANWPHVVIVVLEDWRHDGLVQSFNSLFVDKFGLFTLIVEHSHSDSTNSLLINIQTALTSKLEERSAHATYNIIVLHLPSDISSQVLEGAALIFHDRRIIWLISTVSLPESMPDANPTVVTLSTSLMDKSFLRGSVQTINNKFELLASGNQALPVTATNCVDSQMVWTPRWLASFHSVDFVSHRKLSYYNFEIEAFSENAWIQMTRISSASNYSFADLAESLAQEKRRMYTLVGVLDRPFTFNNEPQVFDGESYCQTPAVICLDIPQSVIKSHSYASNIVKQVFTDFYRGLKVAERNYTVYCCEGLVIDLLQTLSNELDFDYELYLSPDGTFGAFEQETGNWTGMVKELIDGRADMVAGSFSIVSSRSMVIDYTAPYYFSGFSMMASKRESTDTRSFTAADPFPPTVWAMFMMLAVIAFMALSSFEWKSPCGMNPTHSRKQESYTLASGIKTVFSLMSGNTLPCKHPKSSSGKWVQSVWGFFGIIYLSAYTANLTSSITDTTVMLEVTGIHDDKLLDLKVAANAKSASESFVETINLPLYNKMTDLQVEDTDEGLKKLRDGDLDVFIHDTSVIDYVTSQENYDCKLYKLGTFSVDSYGTAFPKGVHQSLKKAVSAKYLEYQESGYIEKLRKIYFPPSRVCVSLTDADDIQLKVANAAGMFIILGGTIILCICLVCVEHLIFRYIIPHAKKKSSDSWWKGQGLMFLSQRIHRAIMQEGAKDGTTVFKDFATRIAKSTNVFALTKKQLNSPVREKLTFYDVVTKAYEVHHRKPFACLYMKGWKRREVLNAKNAHAVTDMARLTAKLTEPVRVRRRYSAMLDESIKLSKIHSNGTSKPDNQPSSPNGMAHLSTIGFYPRDSMNHESSDGLMASPKCSTEFLLKHSPQTSSPSQRLLTPNTHHAPVYKGLHQRKRSAVTNPSNGVENQAYSSDDSEEISSEIRSKEPLTDIEETSVVWNNSSFISKNYLHS